MMIMADQSLIEKAAAVAEIPDLEVGAYHDSWKAMSFDDVHSLPSA